MSATKDKLIIEKELIENYGLNIAVFLSELITKPDKLEADFEYSINEFEKNTGLGRWAQKQVIDKITKLNFIQVYVRGCPPKRYFKINYENLPECLKSRPPTQKPNEIAVLEKAKPERSLKQAKYKMNLTNYGSNTQTNKANKKHLSHIKKQ